uniref:apoptosis facilitator Bcl-2-like protein 14 isoform X2 n=1 Tax=Semicossyphus pulcher TaxID=241346 RepID=UPI0037E99117
MANGHVEIHDLISNHKDCEHTSTSDTDSMEDTQEFRLLMAYAQRRRPKKDTVSPAQDSPIKLVGQIGLPADGSPQVPEAATKKAQKKKKKGWKLKILSCISPPKTLEKPEELSRTVEEPDVTGRSCTFRNDWVEEDEKLKEAASRLTKIIDDIPFVPPEVETDSPDDLEAVIGLLLREAGDQLNESEELKKVVSRILWNYSFFDNLMTTFLTRMSLLPSSRDVSGPRASQTTQIAVACEVTRRLSAADTLPMSRQLGFGAKYLHEHYSSWVQQQGGYEEAFYSEDEDDIQ